MLGCAAVFAGSGCGDDDASVDAGPAADVLETDATLVDAPTADAPGCVDLSRIPI